MERIRVAHVGSSIRPQELLACLSAVDQGRASTDSVEYQAALAKAVSRVGPRQVEAASTSSSTCASRELWGAKAYVQPSALP
jgi:hypothetical protein